jgi:hypothetical protein
MGQTPGKRSYKSVFSASRIQKAKRDEININYVRVLHNTEVITTHTHTHTHTQRTRATTHHYGTNKRTDGIFYDKWPEPTQKE